MIYGRSYWTIPAQSCPLRVNSGDVMSREKRERNYVKPLNARCVRTTARSHATRAVCLANNTASRGWRWLIINVVPAFVLQVGTRGVFHRRVCCPRLSPVQVSFRFSSATRRNVDASRFDRRFGGRPRCRSLDRAPFLVACFWGRTLHSRLAEQRRAAISTCDFHFARREMYFYLTLLFSYCS